MERLHICVIGVAKTFEPSFRKRPDRVSIPVALLVFISIRKSDMVFSETLVKWKGFSLRLGGLSNSRTELISNLFGPVGNFSIKFCARFEKNSLKLLAMEREQKDKPSFSFRQIFVGGVFVLGRPRFLRFFQNSLGEPVFSSSFFGKIFFLFLFN